MTQFGTYRNLYAADSLWNSYPVNPKLDSWEIPVTWQPGSAKKIINRPSFAAGAYSTGVFEALPTDPPRTIYGATAKGIWEPDAGVYLPSITIPHFPADAGGASGSDGHCDIVDVAANRVYSSWQMRTDDAGRVTAAQICWTPLNGHGFGSPSHVMQGARAAGVPTSGGLIRKGSYTPGIGPQLFMHALAISLDYSGMKDGYVYPATSSDKFNGFYNTGRIPEGARVMLPASFDLSRITSVPLQWICRTLMKFGGLVVDRNTDCSIAGYVEIGAEFKTMPNGWDNTVAAELEIIRSQVRMMTECDGYTNGNGQPRMAEVRPSLMALPKKWSVDIGEYDTFNQRWNLDATGAKSVRATATASFPVTWAKPIPGKFYKLYSESNCGAVLQISVYSTQYNTVNSAALGNGQSCFLEWQPGAWAMMIMNKPANSPAGYLSARFIEVSEAEYNAGKSKIAFAMKTA